MLFKREPQDLMSGALNDLVFSFESYQLVSHLTEMEIFPLNVCSPDSQDQAKCRALYKKEYYRGSFTVVLTQLLKHNVLDPSYLLDNIDEESILITTGRPLRNWIYAILNNALEFSLDNHIYEAVRIEDVCSYEVVVVPNLQELLLSIRSTLDLNSSRLVLQSRKTRYEDFFRIILASSKNFKSADSNLYSSSYSTLILVLCYLRARFPEDWSEGRIISATILGVVSAHNQNILPPLVKKITGCRGMIRSISPISIQYSSQLLATLYWMTFLGESLVHVSVIPLDSSFYDGSMLHELSL